MRYKHLEQIQNLRRSSVCIATEINDQGHRLYELVDYTDIDALPTMESLHEVLWDMGRLVFDFDLPSCNIPISRIMKNIEYLLISVFYEHIDMKYADILREKAIQWDNTSKDTYSPFFWSWSNRADKHSMHLTLPFWTSDRVYTYKVLYDIINRECKKSSLFSYLNVPLIDTALYRKNASLRIPTTRKYGMGDEYVHKTDGRPLRFCISNIYGALIPDDYKLEIAHHMVHPYILNMQYEKEAHPYGVHTSVDISKKELWDTMKSIGIDTSHMKSIEHHKPTCESDIGYHICMNNTPYLCPRCNVYHDGKRMPLFMIRSNSIYLDCWRGIETQTLSSKFIMKLDINDNKERRYKKLESLCDSVFSTNILTSSDDMIGEWRYIPTIPNKDTVFIVSPMGTGKTYAIRKYIENHPDISVLILSTRVAYANQEYNELKDLGFIHYGMNSTWTSADRLIIQMESLYRCEKDSYDLVIVDESEGVFRSFVSSTMHGKEFATTSMFNRYLRMAKTVIVSDALATNDMITYVSHMRRFKSSVKIVNRIVLDPKDSYMYSNYNKWIDTLIRDDRRKFIPMLSCKKAIDIASRLATKGENTLLIIGNANDYVVPQHKNMIVGMRDPDTWISYHNVVITPTITNGISFNHKHFHTVYAYGSKGSCHAQDLMQMIHRIRHYIDSDIHIHLNMKSPKRVDYRYSTFTSIMKTLNHGIHLYDNDKITPGIVGMWMNGDMDQKYLYAHGHVRNTLGQLFFKQICMKLIVDRMKWNIIDIDDKLESQDMVLIIPTTINPLSEYIADVIRPNIPDENIHRVGRVMRMMQGMKKIDKKVDISFYMNRDTYCQYRELVSFFNLGGVDIHNIDTECTLRFDTKICNSKEGKDILDKLSFSWKLPYSLSCTRKWSNIESFLKDDVLCIDTQYKRKDHGNRYDYTFKWIWKDMKPRVTGIRDNVDGDTHTVYDYFYELNNVPYDIIGLISYRCMDVSTNSTTM